MSGALILIIEIAYWALFILILARVILSWVQVGSYEIRDLVFRLTEPILAPIRRILPASAGLDLSPMIALIGAWILRSILVGLVS